MKKCAARRVDWARPVNRRTVKPPAKVHAHLAFKHIERNESDIIVADPFTGEVKKKIHSAYPNNSAAHAASSCSQDTPTARLPPMIRYDVRAVVENQCRFGLQCPADDLRSRRQTICCNSVGPEPNRQGPACFHPRVARYTQPDDAVRIRFVIRIVSPTMSRALAML